MKYLKKYSTEAERQAATAIEPSASIVVEDEGVYYDRAWDTPTEVIHENKSPYWTWDWQFIRPAEWPDLDIFDIDNNYCIVMTYDCRDRKANPTHNNDRFFIRTQNNITVERGNVVNGQFVVNDTISLTGTTNYSELLPTTEGDYVVYKITTPAPTSWFRCFVGGEASWRTEEGYISINNNKILEVQGNIPGFNAAFYPWYSIHLRRLLWYSYNSKPMYLYSYCLGNNSIEHFEFKNPWYISGSAQDWFHNASKLLDFDFDNFIFSQAIVTLVNCFQNCSNLKEVHFGSNFPDVSGIANCFRECGSLEVVDTENINRTTACKDHQYMFFCCHNLQSLDLSTWDFSDTTSLTYAFYDCKRLESITFGNYNFGNLTTLDYSFSYCSSLVSIPLSGKTIDFSKVTKFQYAFQYCYYLYEMDMSNWTCSMTASNTTQMFDYCYGLVKVAFPASTTGMHNYILRNCYNLKTIIVNATTPPTYALTTNLANAWNPNYKIYVPDASVDTYKTATGWLNAADHIYGISTYTGD